MVSLPTFAPNNFTCVRARVTHPKHRCKWLPWTGLEVSPLAHSAAWTAGPTEVSNLLDLQHRQRGLALQRAHGIGGGAIGFFSVSRGGSANVLNKH